jgi:hypothetical protein
MVAPRAGEKAKSNPTAARKPLRFTVLTSVALRTQLYIGEA